MTEAWLKDFRVFLRDVGPRPTPHHSLDRWPNQNGNYEPGNCRWATTTEQAFNKRSNRLLMHKGEATPITVLARVSGMSPGGLRHRLETGMPLSEALTRPLGKGARPSAKIKAFGEEMTIPEWAQRIGVKEATLRKRLIRPGWTVERAISAPDEKSDKGRGGMMVQFNGKEMTVAKMAKEHGIPRSLLRNRIAAGWTVEKALTTPRLR